MQTLTLLTTIDGTALFSIWSFMWPGIIVFTVIVSALIYYDRLYRRMQMKESKLIQANNSRLANILQGEGTQVWIYDVATRRYTRLNAQGQLESNDYTPIDFSRFFNRDDFEELRTEIFSLRDGKKTTSTLKMHGPKTNGSEQQRYEVIVTVLERNAKNQPTIIMGVQHNITNQKQQRERERELLLRYKNVFNSSIIDMVFYDENGILTDINDKSMQTFHIKDKQRMLDANQHITEMTSLGNIDLDTLDPMTCTSIIDMNRLEKEGSKNPNIGLQGLMYYEMMIYPVRDEYGELLGIFMEGRDITDMVNTYKAQQQSMKELQQTTNEVRAYIDNTNQAMKMADCRIINYLPDTHTLQITSDLDKPQFELSQIRAIDTIDSEYQLTARRFIHQMDRRRVKSISTRLKTVFSEPDGEKIWLAFNGVAMHDENGKVTHYFGMSRNDTRLVKTEREIKAETLKAQEAEALKETFLLNMSYEIRTPLATVIGFAELFDKEHDIEDEPIFVEEIKKSSNSLLELVNDILYISRIDAKMIQVKRQTTDFALTFDAHCHMGWSANLNTDIKTIVENPYEHLQIVVDEEMVGKVIEYLTHYAIFYTEEGMVRAKYEYRMGALNITIENTGKGISADTLPHVFDRFYRDNSHKQCGSGLLLPIVKGLVELMDGNIELSSEEGKGTTIWISIPCELVSSELKKDII